MFKKIKEMIKNIAKKAPKTIAAGATIATVGLATTGCNGSKEVAVKDDKTVEQEKSYTDTLKVALKGHTIHTYQEPQKDEIQDLIQEIETVEDLLKFIKNLFLEEYEQKTGDTNLTTEDIEIWERTQDRVYVDEDTGVMYTHGDAPAITMEALKEHGINYYDIEDVEVYEIKKKNGEVIDCGALEEDRLKEVILGKDLFTDKEYASILITEKMGRMVPIVFECIYYMEQESNLGVTRTKNEMIKILKEYENENLELVSENDEELEYE